MNEDVKDKRRGARRAGERGAAGAATPAIPTIAEDTIIRLVASGTIDNKAALDEETVFYHRAADDDEEDTEEVREDSPRDADDGAVLARRQIGGTLPRPGSLRVGAKAPAKKSVKAALAPAKRKEPKPGKPGFDEETVHQPNEARRWVVGPVEKAGRRFPETWEYLPPETVVKERFVILEMVGQGGMGQVYKALDRRREEIGVATPYVALKVLKPGLASDASAVDAFKREAATAQLLSSPRVVEVIDYDQDDGLHFIVSEFLTGESLHALLKRLDGKPLDPRRAVGIVSDLAEALRYSHSKGVVHADFKPGNAFVCDDGRVKLLDFGVARTFGAATVRARIQHTEGGDLQGVTPAYASCEVLEGKRPDPRDDIFSLAVVAYRLLSGAHPFGGRTAIEARELDLSPPRIRSLKPAPWRTLRRGLALNRSERVQTVHAFIEGFTGNRAGANFRARMASVFNR